MAENRLRVLLDVHDLRVASTGIRTYIHQLIRALELLSEEGTLDLKVYPDPRKISNTYFQKNSKIRSLIFHPFTILWKQLVLPILVWREKADVLICPDFYAPFWRLRSKKVVVFHDAFFWENPSHYSRWWGWYFRRAIIVGLRGESIVLTVSEASKKSLRPIIPAKTDIAVARTSMDFSSPVDKAKAPAEFAYFLHVGVFEKRKNLPMLIKAFRMARDQVGSEDLKLVLIGNQWPRQTTSDREAILQTIEREGLSEFVICEGHLSFEEVFQYYHGALGYVFPSLSEGFGLPILEAFHAGLPVITSDLDVLQEIGGGASLVAGRNDPEAWASFMCELYERPELRAELIEKGRTRLGDFTLSNFARQLERVLIA